jgi:teichuronic acid biosynthesis glycosyltransferase TuaC
MVPPSAQFRLTILPLRPFWDLNEMARLSPVRTDEPGKIARQRNDVIRVLTLSTLFPDSSRPTFGIFVERQTLGLAACKGVELQVVSPVGLPPGPLRLHPPYRARSQQPRIEQWKGLTVHRPTFLHFPGPGLRFAPALMARALLPLLRDIQRDFPFDIIDAEYFWPDGPAAAKLGRALGVPVSIKARGSDIHLWGQQRDFSRRQIVEAGKQAGGMLAVSEALRRDMISLGLNGDAIKVHYTGVDLQKFAIADREAAKAALGIKGSLIVCVGYLIDRKGQSLLVEAMKHLPGVTLLLVGDGPARDALRAQIAAANLASRVHILGPQPHEALPTLFTAADVSVLPSASEGLANVWVESLACGTPVVIADAGGARELVNTSAAGRIVERNPEAIAAGVFELLASPPDPHATRRCAERFTWEANAQALHAHLSDLIERHQRGDDPAILSA